MQFEIFIVLKIYFMVLESACHEVWYTGIAQDNTLPSPYCDNLEEGEGGGQLGCSTASDQLLNNTHFVADTML